MNKEITSRGQLLDEAGMVKRPGWSRKMLLDYHRNSIKAPKIQIKEWDYYAILNDQYGLSLTVADNGYLGFIAATYFDFTGPIQWSNQVMLPFPMGKFKMPETTRTGHVLIEHKKVNMKFYREKDYRQLVVEFPNFHHGETLEADIKLTESLKDNLVIATPFHKDKRFYYNHKINCLKPDGYMKIGKIHCDFDSSYDGVLDWGRGVWTYDNTWYWGSASGQVNGKTFGFNIGYGFGDTTAASENIIFYNGVGHKLDQITFNIPKDSYMKPWTFTSNDGRFEMEFMPLLDRCSKTNVLFLVSDQHQVFGHFSGKVVLDDGQIIQIKNFFGFAEEVMNRW